MGLSSKLPAVLMLLGACCANVSLAAGNYPITQEQRTTAGRVAQEGGVPLSELVDNAPDSHTVKRGDTLWDISKLFLKSPWRWPELWGMNMEQVRNPHLIYPGQILYLDKRNGRATLRLGRPVGGDSSKLQPRIRSSDVRDNIAMVPMGQIEPFLNEAVIFDHNELSSAPRIVATQDGRVMVSRGETAYVRGELGGNSSFRVFREPKPLLDPTTKQLLGYEAVYLGSTDLARKGDGAGASSMPGEVVPDTFTITSVRQEIRAGDRLHPTPPREFSSFGPHAPSNPVQGQIVSVYGEAVTAGQNQIVAINRGKDAGMEAGHILALWRDGQRIVDKTEVKPTQIKLPDERHGLLFVFRVFDRMSYALILSVKDPVNVGDRFTQP
jgi:hypothetical protein